MSRQLTKQPAKNYQLVIISQITTVYTIPFNKEL